jgi:hypothetical protein
MRTIKTYRKVGAFYIACEEDFPTSIPDRSVSPRPRLSERVREPICISRSLIRHAVQSLGLEFAATKTTRVIQDQMAFLIKSFFFFLMA